MPKMSSSGVPKKSELPATLRHSDAKAQRTFAKTYDSAMEEYDDEERAHQVAYDALKHTHEKVGDKWEPKSTPGPSDAQAKGGKNTERPTAGGVDADADEGPSVPAGDSAEDPRTFEDDQERARPGFGA